MSRTSESIVLSMFVSILMIVASFPSSVFALDELREQQLSEIRLNQSIPVDATEKFSANPGNPKTFLPSAVQEDDDGCSATAGKEHDPEMFKRSGACTGSQDGEGEAGELFMRNTVFDMNLTGGNIGEASIMPGGAVTPKMNGAVAIAGLPAITGSAFIGAFGVREQQTAQVMIPHNDRPMGSALIGGVRVGTKQIEFARTGN